MCTVKRRSKQLIQHHSTDMLTHLNWYKTLLKIGPHRLVIPTVRSASHTGLHNDTAPTVDTTQHQTTHFSCRALQFQPHRCPVWDLNRGFFRINSKSREIQTLTSSKFHLKCCGRQCSTTRHLKDFGSCLKENTQHIPYRKQSANV